MTKIALMASAALLGLWSQSAWAAGTATTNMNVSLSVTAGCTVAASDIAFGAVQGSTAAAPADAGSTLTVTCTNGTPYTVSFASSNDLDTTGASKKMVGTGSASNTLAYELVNASSTSTIYGKDEAHQISDTGTGSPISTNLQAHLTDWSAFKPIDSYSDTVTVSVDY